MSATELHFDEGTATAAVIGAVLGAVAVLGAFAVVLLLTGSDRGLMAAGALAAGFGGTGFGAMLGAVLASVRSLEPALVPVEATTNR